MPNLDESLQGRDIGYLRIIAELWGIELVLQDSQSAVNQLKMALVNPPAVNAVVAGLTEEARKALDELSSHSGRLPWPQFVRNYGDVREVGVAKRDRERLFEHPISVTEVLWYRALVARAFFDTPTGPEEFAYIPDDLLALIPHAEVTEKPSLGRQASGLDYASISLADDRILDHACTLLAALRMGMSMPDTFFSSAGEIFTITFLKTLLAASELLDEAGEPISEPVRIFLEAPRGEALLQLFRRWKASTLVNELRLLPDLITEGNWENDPLRTRSLIIDYISSIPAEKWWNLSSFISAIKLQNPDFQRPAGDYDSWFIRDRTSGEYLRGFENWDAIDGRLLRYILTGPLHWLGVLDMGSPVAGEEVTAFRLSGWSQALLRGESPRGLALEEVSLLARSDARISAERLVLRPVRYQLARFCEWEKETPEGYQYRISSASLSRARQQGLLVSQLISLLNRHVKTMPPSLIKALERWDKRGSEARMEKMVVLRVASQDILEALRKSRARRFLGQTLGPTTVEVNSGAIDKITSALTELGYLAEIRGEVD